MTVLATVRRLLFERRATLSDPPAWFVESLTGGPVAAGVSVNEQTALSFAAVYACVRIIAESISSLPLKVLEHLEPRGSRPARGHAAYELLHDEANPVSTAFTVRETLCASALLWGNAYAEIERARDGRPLALWPLEPSRVQPYVATSRSVRYSIDDGKIDMAAADVLHVPAFGRNGITGLSPIRLHRESIGLGVASERSAAGFYGNGSRPGGVLEYPGTLRDEARKNLRESWERLHKGPDQAGRVAVLEGGAKFTPIGIPPDDAQFLETRKFQVVEVARIFRVPPHLLADLERATFSNIEAQGLEFVVHTLRPWLVRFEQEYRRKLLTRDDRLRGLHVQHNVDGLLRGDTAARVEMYRTGREWGWLSADDVREMEDQNPLPDGAGEVYLQPLNMVPAGTETARGLPIDGDQVDEDEVDEGEDEVDEGANRAQVGANRAHLERRSLEGRERLRTAHRRLFAETAARLVSRESIAVRRAAKRFGGGGTRAEFERWLADYYRKHEATVRDSVAGVIDVYGHEVDRIAVDELGERATSSAAAEGREAALGLFLAAYAGALAVRWVRSSSGQLGAIAGSVELGELARAIGVRLDEWRERRPGKFARRETSQLAQAVSRETYRRFGAGARWVTSGENCPMCRALDGRRVSAGGSFGESGDRFGEGEQVLELSRALRHPPLHDGCDCQIVADL